MRLQPIGVNNSALTNRIKNKPVKSPKINDNSNTGIVNFKGREDHVIFYGAEFPDYNKKGGVANVMGYYEKMPGIEATIVQTYYNGQKNYNKKGEYTGRIKPWQFDGSCKYPGLQNQYFYVKFNTDKKNIKKETTENLDGNLKSKNIIVLKKIAEKSVIYGKQEEQNIFLFKAMNAVPVKNEAGEIVDYKLEELPKDNDTGKARNHFFVYSKGTAEFKEPYDDGSYNSDKSANPEAFSRFKPQAYAENNRAFVDLKQELCDAVITTDGSKFEPGTVVCSDTQTAYTISYMRDEAIKGNPAFSPEDIAPAYVIHNLRAGYTGECGGLDFALNLGLTSDEIDLMKKDPEYIKAEEEGNLEAYFSNYIPELRDGSGAFNPTLIAFKLRQSGYMTGLNTVSPGYAWDIAYNTCIPTSLQYDWQQLYINKNAIGIMNPFEDPNFHIFKGVLGMNGYLESGVNESKEKLVNLGGDFAKLADEIHPFEKVDESKFPKNNGNYTVTEEGYNDYLNKKNINKKEFLNRLTSKFDILISKDKDLYNTIIAGRPNWNVNLIGRIDENLLAPENIGNLKVYVSWGRLDSQKSLDIVMDAFDMYCNTHPEDAQNCILVLGGEAPGTKYSDKILAQANKMADKHKGRFAFMEAFAPGKILASVAEMALLPSREAPCELTDLETMQFMTLLTATNAQGMADKNFDPDIEGEKEIATSFKTESGYYIPIKNIAEYKKLGIGEKWKEEYEQLIASIEDERANREACSFDVNPNENETLVNYINANPTHKKALDELLDKYRSLILAAGVAACIERGTHLTLQQRMKMAENEINLKTGWTNNQLLAKADGKSSADLYKDIFKTKANPDTSRYSTPFLNKLREHLNTLKNKPTNVVINEHKKGFLSKYGKVIAWSAASALVAGSAVYYFATKSQNNTQPGMRIRKHPHFKPHIDIKHKTKSVNINA